MLYSDEQIQRANDQSITDFFRGMGYSADYESGEMHIHGFGGLKVDEERKLFHIHSRQVGGYGLVYCLQTALGMSYPEAIKTALNGEMPNSNTKDLSYTKRQFPIGELPPKREKPVKEFIMPQKDKNNRRIISYLTEQRRISPQVVNELINTGLLFQDVKGNAIFLDVKDGVPCGAEFHGTGRKKYTIGKAKYAEIENRTVIKTEPYIAYQVGEILKDEKDMKFVGYIYENEANIAANEQDAKLITDIIEAVRNSDIDKEMLESTVKQKLKSFNGVAEGTAGNFFEYVKFPNPQGAYVFESAIDMMSFMHLHPNAQNCEFVSMGGLKPSVVETLLQRGLKVALCVDNDEKGKFFCEGFGDRCTVITECHKNGVKDFNELLQKLNPKKNFTDTVKRISEWSDRVQEKAAAAKEALYENNKPLKTQYVR